MTKVVDIVILGGTGFLGRALLAQLVERSGGAGGRLVVPTRRLQRGRAILSLPTVELREADVCDESQLAGCLRGAQAVVNLVAILHGSAADFERLHVGLPRTLARACAAAGVRRVLHVSALGAAADAPSLYLRSKAAGEAVLREAGLDLTLFRPSVMFGAEDRLLNTFARLQLVLPVLPLASPNARFQPVWVEDVARAIVRCIDRPDTIGRSFECTGPQQFTLRELVRAAGRWSGHARPVLPLPAPLGRAQAALMEMLPGTPLLSRDNLDSMRVPSVAGGQLPGLAALGITPAALEAVAPLYLAGATVGRGRLNALRAAARRG
ncbi:MAG TPA: complex I NDUFA9 subunit family protein [Ideonella sp.]|nr:complex I NDUFA9 subunit family protein [Ideonella sp.]